MSEDEAFELDGISSFEIAEHEKEDRVDNPKYRGELHSLFFSFYAGFDRISGNPTLDGDLYSH